jgi:hypothetical protein
MSLVWNHMVGLAIVLLLAIFMFVAHGALKATLWEPAYLTGWLLLGGILVLTLYNARKKLPFLPLGKARNWLRLHLYLGWFVLIAFFIHIDFRMPSGVLEGTIAALFLVVALSGVLGAWISRTIPKRLTRRGEEVIFERIPVFMASLREEADDLAIRSVEETRSTSIADFHIAYLKPWFAGPRDFWQHLFELNTRRYEFDQRFETLNRYLNDRERDVAAELQSIVCKKSDLDYHHALQKVLKAWLFVHIPATYSLLTLIAAHVVLVHAFTGARL